MKTPMKFLVLLSLLGLTILSSGPSIAAKFQKIDKSYAVNPQKTLTVVMEIDAGQVRICCHDAPSQVHVSTEYDDRYDQIEISHHERTNEFSLFMDRDNWLKSVDDDRTPNLMLSLPTDVVMVLDSKIKAGEIKFELGGLKLRDFKLHNYAGEVEINFDTPNLIEMEFLDIDVSIGETTLRRLGNARFHRARINGGIGELSVDFSGEGSSNAHADIDLDIGETTIYLPRGLGVRFDHTTLGFLTEANIDFDFDKKGHYYYSQGYESAAKTLDCSISAGIGELRVIYR